MAPFLAYSFRHGATDCCAIDADVVVVAFGHPSAFVDFFGGCLTFGLPSAPEYLGVWGTRNAARFRRLVRQAGFDLVAKAGYPPARLTVKTKNLRRLDRRARLHYQALLPARRQ